MKPYKFLLCLCLLMLLSACSQHTATDKPYDIALFDTDKILTFKDKGNQLEPIDEIRRTNKLKYSNHTFQAAGSYYVSKTLADPKLREYVASIDIKRLTETVQPAAGNTVYTSISDGEFYFTTAVYTDHIDFYKYNMEMEAVHHTRIDNGETINSPAQFVIINDTLYLLVNTVITATGTPNTELWKMDKQFTILEKIDLQESSALLRMVSIDNDLYLLEALKPFEGDGNYISGDRIVKYNLESQEKTSFPISAIFPEKLRYDEQNNSLLIQSEGTALQKHLWLLYDLDTNQERIIQFEEVEYNSAFQPSVLIKEGTYYFLFKDKLIKYKPSDESQEIFPLSDYGITDVHAFIVQ